MATQSDILNSNLDWLQKGKEEVFAEYKIADHKTIHDRIEKARRSTFDRSKFTVVGSPTITEDGIASGFSNTSYLSNIPLNIKDKSWELKFKYTITETPSTSPSIIWTTLNDDGLKVLPLSAGGIRVYFGNTPHLSIYKSVQVSDECVCEVSYDNTNNNCTLKWYLNGELIDVVTDTRAGLDDCLIYLGARPNINSFTYGSIDLKQFSITVDGIEVFNGNKTGVDTIGDIEIPYTQASNGAKIVDATYRERVQNMYEQLGYTHYYTISEEDYTLATRESYGLLQDGLKTKQDTISDIDTIRTNASSAKSTVDTHVANTTIHVTAQDKVAWSQKQNAIPDLEQIRTNAKTGSDLAPQVATNTQRIEDLTTARIPDVIYHGTPKITGGQVTNFSTVNYLQFPFEDISRSLPFDIYFSFTTDDDVTTQQNIIDSHFGIALAIQNSKGIMALSSNGTSWDIGSVTGTNTILPNTTYYVKYSWTGTEYNASLSTNDQSYVPDMVLQSNKSPFKTTIYIGGSEGLFGPNTAHPFKGIINFSKSRVDVNGITVWEGMADVGIASRANVSLNNLDEVGEKRFADKQDLITDLSTIRDGANKGATALQSVPDEYITETDLETRLSDLDTGLYYDPSGFTVVGSPTITEDGIASGFSTSRYFKINSVIQSNNWTIQGNILPVENIDNNRSQTICSEVDSNANVLFNLSLSNSGQDILFYIKDIISISWSNVLTLGKFQKVKLIYNNKTLYLEIDNILNSKTVSIDLDNFSTTNILWLGYNYWRNIQVFYGQIDLKQFSITVDGQEVFSGGKYLINDNNLDTTYIAKNTDLQQVKTDLATTDAIAKSAQQAVTFSNYQNAVTNINSYAYDKYNVGQNIMVETLDVPDLWVSAKFSDSQTYTYTTDDAIINALKTDGHIRAGRYQLSALETGKVDLSTLVHKTGDETISGTKTFTSTIVGTTTRALQDGNGDVIATTYLKVFNINLIEGAEQWL